MNTEQAEMMGVSTCRSFEVAVPKSRGRKTLVECQEVAGQRAEAETGRHEVNVRSDLESLNFKAVSV